MTKYLAEYKPFEYQLSHTELNFILEDVETVVESKLMLERTDPESTSILLDGENLELMSIHIDGRELTGNEYRTSDSELEIFDVPEKFVLQIKNKINPGENQTKVGLYKSNDVFCTQCEPEAFRSITFFPDRPDVLSIFKVTVDADSEKYPVILSNGNTVESDLLPNGRRRVTFEDPFPKPSYLFALIAGELNKLEDEYVTSSGRRVSLAIYLENRDPRTCEWAMDSLKKAMEWDERVYGREYDLDQFNVVGVDHFVFGAMENKGLNIFNSSALLATPDFATDAGYRRIQGIVAHEYFHNWSGDRVTCRDWFQLSLKEGFTVMRDAHFSADMNGHAVKNIQEAQLMREEQFPEDRGPQVHAVRPSFYDEINNNYTRTVYEKGAQIVRMLSVLLGPEQWRQTTDLYFSRHDGQAVTIEDFLRAAEDVSGRDLTQFKLWYTQSGNPYVNVDEVLDGTKRHLTITQGVPPTQDQPDKAPMHIPLAVGIVQDNHDLLIPSDTIEQDHLKIETDLEHTPVDASGTMVFDLKERTHRLEFDGLPPTAQISLLRGFSAPVTLRYQAQHSLPRLIDLALNDTDGFSRHEAVKTLMILALAEGDEEVLKGLNTVVGTLLERAIDSEDVEARELLVLNLVLPSELVVLDDFPGTDLSMLIDRRKTTLRNLADANLSALLTLLDQNQIGEGAPYSPDNASIARRGMVKTALSYLQWSSEHVRQLSPQVLRENYTEANNLTDRLTYLSTIIEQDQNSIEERVGLLEDFYDRWHHEDLVLDKWYQLQASSRALGTAERVVELSNRDADSAKSPNRVRAVWGSWSSNVEYFHKSDGSGYRLLGKTIAKWDKASPQVASRLMMPFVNWHRFDSGRQALIKEQLEMLYSSTESPDVQDLTKRSLEFVPPVDSYGSN